MSNDAIPMDFETFAARRGGSRLGFGESGVHKRSRHQSDKQWMRIIKNIIDHDIDLADKREKLRIEYAALIEQGILREPTPKEVLLQTASGHPDNASVQAARRILARRFGIVIPEPERTRP